MFSRLFLKRMQFSDDSSKEEMCDGLERKALSLRKQIETLYLEREQLRNGNENLHQHDGQRRDREQRDSRLTAQELAAAWNISRQEAMYEKKETSPDAQRLISTAKGLAEACDVTLAEALEVIERFDKSENDELSVMEFELLKEHIRRQKGEKAEQACHDQVVSAEELAKATNIPIGAARLLIEQVGGDVDVVLGRKEFEALKNKILDDCSGRQQDKKLRKARISKRDNQDKQEKRDNRGTQHSSQEKDTAFNVRVVLGQEDIRKISKNCCIAVLSKEGSILLQAPNPKIRSFWAKILQKQRRQPTREIEFARDSWLQDINIRITPRPKDSKYRR